MSPRLLPCTVALTVAVSGCASPASRISASLRAYGFDKATATCVGTRLQKSLTLLQLRQLGRAAGELPCAQGDAVRVDDLMRAADKVNDIKVPIEVAKAAGACGVIGPRL